MNTFKPLLLFVALGSWFYLETILTPKVVGQIVPDSTLPVNSTITIQENTNLIEGGTRSGGNLFHSFQEFSVPTGSNAYFNNTLDVQNILTRVTTNSISNIDGTIEANGNANLFLLNPNGVIFGSNARLNIGGSFLATTANSLIFADRTQFSATQTQGNPILTISVPVGLQFETNPGVIHVRGTGHNLTKRDPIFSPIIRNNDLTGLRVQPGQTLALIGGNVVLEGGNLAAGSGSIELGSVGSGFVSLNLNNSARNLDYSGVTQFQDIQLSGQALVDTSGGSISLQGRTISLRDGSILLIQNLGSQLSGNININATESVRLAGISSDGIIRSGFFSQTLGTGRAGNIMVSTPKLFLEDAGGINTSTYSNARTGDININASQLVQINGFFIENPIITSSVSSTSLVSGDLGNIAINTGRLIILNGSNISSSIFGTGSGGNITVNAANSIEIIGVNPLLFYPSSISATTLGTGDAGNLSINTSRLTVRDGGAIGASTLARGAAGSVTINASESIEVSGNVPGIRPTGIESSALTVDPNLQQLLRLSPLPSGTSGDVTMNTPELNISDGALVSVRNQGARDAGTLRINADSIFLSDRGRITAETASGSGGNIILQAGNLQLRNTQISAEARGSGNGGNITINAETIANLQNGRITANAIEGQGGNIQIVTRGIFSSNNSNISASSALGVSGMVEIQTPDTEVQSSFTVLSSFTTPDVAIASRCLSGSSARGRFAVTGTGGLPSTPYDAIGSRYSLIQVRLLSGVSDGERFNSDKPWKEGDPIVEARGIVRTANGGIMLVAGVQEALVSTKDLVCDAN